MITKKTCRAYGFQGEIRQQEEMRKHTSFRIGGPADLFVIPASASDLTELLKALTEEDIPYFILGRGTNLLVSDRGVRGVVIEVGPAMMKFDFSGEELRAEAGVPLALLARTAAERGLSGLEFAAGIPGTVGGAVVMNAGSGGGDIYRLVSGVRTFNPGAGIKDWTAKDCQFDYRSSHFRGGDEIILEVELKLEPGSPSVIKEKMDSIMARRKKSLPLKYPSAGSIFQNPPGDYAARLIEATGLRGEIVGGAQISNKHANIIVNRSTASCRDVEQLIAQAREKVREKFNIELELELGIWK